MKKAIFRLIVLAILVGGGYYGYRTYKKGPQRMSDIATAKVQQGDVVIRAFTRGELKAVRTYQLYAPNLNGTIQVTQLAPMGALAREKDLVVEYDDSELLATIDADKLSLDTADESIKSQKLQMQITRSSDDVDLLSAKFAVERAKLNVQKNDVLDEITAKKNKLALTQAERALEQTATNIEMRKAQQDTQMAQFNSMRRRAQQTLFLDQQRLATTRTLAPMTGLVAIKQNRAGNFNFGQQMPDIRTGDQLQAGMNVADLLDLSEMEMSAKVGEMDRANLKEGQAITIQLDAIPDKRFPGTIKTLSGTATSDVFSGDPSKKFDVTFAIDMRTMLKGLGMEDADVQRIMNTAAENAKKNLVSFAPAGGGRGGRGGMDFGPGGPGGPGGMPEDLGLMAAMRGRGQGGGGEAGQAGQGRGSQNGQAQGRGGQQDAQAAQGRGQRRGGEDAQAGQGRGGQQQDGQAAQGRGRRGQDGQAQGGGQDAQAGQGRGQGRGGPGGGRGMGGFGFGGGINTGMNFTEEERANAQLPKPPEEDSEVSKLLRPGLLADVEIEVEKIPNALHVPRQSVVTKNGVPTVFVKAANGKFEPRAVEIVRQSESMMVLKSGVKAGEVVALSDPTASKNKQQNTEEKKSSGGPSFPGGK